jgi:cation diffusion facilitator CzcD-associated flavoprotein CzcO
MLQRSPSYVVALPARDPISAVLRRVLPRRAAYELVRWKNILITIALFQYMRRWPQGARRLLMKLAQERLPGIDVQKHFNPRYDPWDQRLCIAPDADVFRVLRSGQASVVTDEIESFTPGGIRLASGQELPADIVVTATGLKLKMLGGARITVDGQVLDLSQRLAYRGAMCSGVPNLAMTMGYTNASWTLKAELIARYVCRLLNHLRDQRYDVCLPVHEGAAEATEPALPLSSGYVQRATAVLPRQGPRAPWRVYQNYVRDLLSLKLSSLHDGAMRFAPRGQTPQP